MGKKSRAKIFCQICNKRTTHELRIIDDQETYICLLCEARPPDISKGHADFKIMDRVVEAERMRIWAGMPKV